MILTWLIGVRGVVGGCGTVAYLREGSMPDETAALEQAKAAPDPVQGLIEFRNVAERRAYAEHAKTTLPLAIGHVLLSLLLVAASAMVLAGRPGSRSLALQALAGNAVLAIVGYVVTSGVRDSWIGAVARAGAEMQFGPTPLPIDLTAPAVWYWAERFVLVFFELGILGVAALAVLSKRTRLFLEAVARAEERLEREDEP